MTETVSRRKGAYREVRSERSRRTKRATGFGAGELVLWCGVLAPKGRLERHHRFAVGFHGSGFRNLEGKLAVVMFERPDSCVHVHTIDC